MKRYRLALAANSAIGFLVFLYAAVNVEMVTVTTLRFLMFMAAFSLGVDAAIQLAKWANARGSER